ncbi:hypothetical protein EUX98_g3754 [Antrodiella citrinella]|uniref:Smr domain-containing protein n=1 Tax=Antrodiella citrinella TaxID=2447956 RepID=A0A4S4MVQ9_9APHY|nr:hypothetical protein EUX98_g3754 [Antrodiella citrinella]
MGFFTTFIKGLIDIVCGGTSKRPQYQDAHVPPAHPHKHQAPSHPEGYTPPIEARPPKHERPPQAKPPSSSPRLKPYQRVDKNQVNHQQNEEYMSLRARANDAGDKMAQCFERSHQAYASGDKAGAKTLSVEGKKHQQDMEKLNREASEWIFGQNNMDSKQGEIDLHGLYVKEAISYTDQAIQNARRRGDSEVVLIVGKGLHSRGGIAKLKPAIEELMQKHSLVAQLDPQNTGVLIVTLNGPHSGAGKVMNPDDITRGIESRGEGCMIM